jgi:alkaline phosphatase
MTRAALRRLSAGDRRFLLVVEAGLIDRACHFMDAGAALAELESLDETLGVLLEARAADPGMLVVLTADHETGGLAVGLPHSGPSARERLALLYTQTRALPGLPGARRRAGSTPPTLEEARVACPWLPDGARPYTDPATDGRTAAFTGVLGVAWAEAASAAAGVVFATDDHSAVPVPVVAAGPGALRFGGLSDLTVVGDHLRAFVLGN